MSTRGWENVGAIVNRLSKFGNVPTTVRGVRYDSKREAAYGQALEARQAAGEISGLRRQVIFPLLCPACSNAAEDRPVMVASYVADFVYLERGVRHVVDVKGVRTALYTLKKKWLYLQDGITIEEA